MNNLNRQIEIGERLVVTGGPFVSTGDDEHQLHVFVVTTGGGMGLYPHTTGRAIYGRWIGGDGEIVRVNGDEIDADATRALQGAMERYGTNRGARYAIPLGMEGWR